MNTSVRGEGRRLPTGIVTFVLTDIEQSTELWERDADAMAAALVRHDQLLGELTQAGGGEVIKSKGEGDSSLGVFPRASAAVATALEMQRALVAEVWPGDLALKVRIALHTGEAYERDGDYYGPTLNRAARLRALAKGGQILVSQSTAEVVADRLPRDATLADLGCHALRGLTREERVFELSGPGLPSVLMAVRVSLVGEVGIENDGIAAGGRALGRLGRLALAYLTSERHRPVPHAELAELLWGEDLPNSWEQLVRGTVSKLRGAFRDVGLVPTDVLTTGFGCYQLHLPPGTEIDTELAAAAADTSTAAFATGDLSRAEAEAAIAVGIASRQFVPGGVGPWVERGQAELRELHLRSLEALADAATAAGRFGRAIDAAETATVLEPFRESAYHRLIAAHAQAGHRGEALRAYERCRRALADELGVSPCPATEAMYVDLLGQEPAATVVSGSAPYRLPLPAALSHVPGTFVVGRAVEQEQLGAALTRATAEGRQAVFVGGEPGAGKTSLVADLARHAHSSGALVLYGRCDEELGLAYQPFAEAVGGYVAHAPLPDLDAHVDVWGGELSRLTPELVRRVPGAPVPAVAEPEAERFRMFEAVAAILAQAAENAPVVLVLDDLHWAAQPSLLLLRHLLRFLTEAPLLVIGTYRHTELGDGHRLVSALADLRREPAVERLMLDGLDEESVTAFVEAFAGEGTDLAGGAVARAIHAHTAGNPFFVGELLRHLAESGAVYRKETTWSYYADPAGAGIPRGVREVVARRLLRLPDEANRALVLASIIGLEFRLDLLEHAMEPNAPNQVLDAIEKAVAGHLVIELRSGEYRFAHALVRDTIYTELSVTRRGRLHRKVGEAIEATSSDGDGRRRVAALAHHFAESTSAGCAQKAADYALIAARHALANAAWEDAIVGLKRALQVIDDAPPVDLARRCDLLLLTAEVWSRQFNPGSALEAALAASDVARMLGSTERLGWAAHAGLSAAYAMRGPEREVPIRAALAMAEEALGALDEDLLALRAILLADLSQRSSSSGDSAEPVIEEALGVARRSADPEALAVTLIASCAAVRGSPRVAEHLARADELISADVADHRKLVGYWQRGLARLASGDRPGFEADLRRLEHLGGERRELSPGAAAWRASLALLDGRFGEVEARMADSRGVPPYRDSFGRELGLRQLVRLRYEVGELGGAADAADHLVREWGDNPMHVVSQMFIRWEMGGFDHPSDPLEPFVGLCSEPMATERRPIVYAYVSEVAAALGDAERARQLHDAFSPWQGQLVVGGMGEACLGAVDRFLGMLSAAGGRWEEADAWFRSAAVLEERVSSPPLLARTWYWHARMLAAREGPGYRDSAVKLLESAVVTTGHLGMQRLHRQVSELLTTLG